MTETVLVTGGSGFIAGWCIVELLQRGYAVRATLRSLAKEAAVRAAIASAAPSTKMLSFVAADLTRDEGWGAAMAGCDYVLHVASPLGSDGAAKPQAMIAAARDGTLRVLRAATLAGVKRVVMTSAAATATPPLNSAQRSLSASASFCGWPISRARCARNSVIPQARCRRERFLILCFA